MYVISVPSSGYSNGFAAGTLASLARTLLIEAAHSYRLPARIGRHKVAAVDAVPEAVRAIAWKAQTRLCKRYRHMMARGKLTQVVVTAIARELAGFVWSIACITSDPVVSENKETELYCEVTALCEEVTIESEGVAQQAQQIAPGTGQPRVPRSPSLKGHDGAARGANPGKSGRNRPTGADRMIAQHHSTG